MELLRIYSHDHEIVGAIIGNARSAPAQQAILEMTHWNEAVSEQIARYVIHTELQQRLIEKFPYNRSICSAIGRQTMLPNIHQHLLDAFPQDDHMATVVASCSSLPHIITQALSGRNNVQRALLQRPLHHISQTVLIEAAEEADIQKAILEQYPNRWADILARTQHAEIITEICSRERDAWRTAWQTRSHDVAFVRMLVPANPYNYQLRELALAKFPQDEALAVTFVDQSGGFDTSLYRKLLSALPHSRALATAISTNCRDAGLQSSLFDKYPDDKNMHGLIAKNADDIRIQERLLQMYGEDEQIMSLMAPRVRDPQIRQYLLSKYPHNEDIFMDLLMLTDIETMAKMLRGKSALQTRLQVQYPLRQDLAHAIAQAKLS